ncbi:cobalamin B12-binding domain-containing protein [Indiicoccus explosivorum]|uniref:cobalamin B12-binding domain-containing protein n=1 Tax=Indiicoccus explosivorum TaxID=1917864 RepID=UPI000B436521|nr:cobalamin-dependent protein [Indiicoccus explosivorum]
MAIQPKELAQLFLEGKDSEALKEVQTFLENQSKKDLYHGLLTPAMIHIGELWERNEISVADEHLATAICDFVMSAVDIRKESMSLAGGQALVLGVEGEQHHLGLKMSASVFREHGWRVHYLGPDLPLDHALAAAERWSPDVIGLSASLAYRVPALRRYIDAFRGLQPKPVVFIGGRVVGITDLSAFEQEGALLFQDLSGLERWLQEEGGTAHYAKSAT